ncbi:acyltransferase [Mesorhizobium sp. WSM3626]|uniref:acyltransferase family protein n=1 Tax=Mesorhizobium sp. WSM3626 TaxID=1040987 RepID=UPI000486FDD5|nr:acyltransferase [Mesorhizobium sp. WSM3626]
MRKDDSLEFLRGVASIVVMFWHMLLGFAPSASGIFANGPANSLQTSFVFVALNGQSAVYLFFVLSSFVLLKRYFANRKIGDLLLAAAKRLPRLAGPVLVTVLLSCLIFRQELYFFWDAGAQTGSPWLANFAYAAKPLTPETANFSDALTQGAWRTFIFGDSYYDTSLWTMWFEFWGSLMVFALAPAIFFVHDRIPLLSWCVLAIGMFLAWSVNFVLVAFPVGLSLHLLLASKFRPNAWTRLALVAVSLALLGYAGNAVGIYRPFAVLEVGGLPENARLAYTAILGSVMLIYAVVTSQSPPSWLTGKAARFLGDLSFPLYLVHVPIICSLGSWVVLASGSTALAAAAAILGSVLTALPLMTFNNWWVQALGALFNKFRRSGPVAAAPAAATA